MKMLEMEILELKNVFSEIRSKILWMDLTAKLTCWLKFEKEEKTKYSRLNYNNI